MLKPAELSLEELGDLAEIIPGPEPELEVSLRRIPVFGDRPPAIIPVCEPRLDGNELRYVTQCIETNWISSAGDFIPRFEAAFARACGVRYGVACANG
ncbi:MAG: DegT/DnrJ/EryC1/StrS family aminotransferase, partial [Anaerolineae bacterium]